jgi:hypothetical protein
MRGDYNGRVLSLRDADVQALALLYDQTPAALLETFTNWGVATAPPS